MGIWDLLQLPKTLKQLNNELEILNNILSRMVNLPKAINIEDISVVFANLKDTNEHLADMKKILADLGGWEVK